MSDTKEPQYQRCLELREQQGVASLGLVCNQTWQDDPKRLTFVLSRYKFASKMLSGRNRVLEVGCGDAFGTRIVKQETKSVTAIDFDALFINDAKASSNTKWPIDLRVHDMLSGPIPEGFDGAYSLDVLEHIPASQEHRFMQNIADSLNNYGILVLGSPSLESQNFASASSKIGHVNCKRGPDLKSLVEKFFHTVFLFSMNDEVVHTGFHPMAHYLIAVGSHKRS